jgi:beta-1,4-N-acetylglucosaminyltransferase
MILNLLLTLALLWLSLLVINKVLLAKRKGKKEKSLMLVFGSGGHTTELLLMIESLNFADYKHVHLVIAKTDTWSMTKIKTHFAKKMLHKVDLEKPSDLFTIWQVARAREVKQSYFTSVFTTLFAIMHSAVIVARCRVDLIVSNGPGTAVPLIYTNWLLGKVMGWRTQTLFIESFCRVDSLSLSGKLVKPITNKFIVHWKQLKALYGDSVIYFEEFKLI